MRWRALSTAFAERLQIVGDLLVRAAVEDQREDLSLERREQPPHLGAEGPAVGRGDHEVLGARGRVGQVVRAVVARVGVPPRRRRRARPRG